MELQAGEKSWRDEQNLPLGLGSQNPLQHENCSLTVTAEIDKQPGRFSSWKDYAFYENNQMT